MLTAEEKVQKWECDECLFYLGECSCGFCGDDDEIEIDEMCECPNTGEGC